MLFDVAGIEISPLVPLLVALCVSTLTSMGGVSGAFVLLPFQVSVLGFVGPAVTPTNHLFNVVAIPSGVFRYVRERRMLWPLAAVTVIGTLPGVVAGSLARIYLLPDPRHFKLFMGLVLLVIGSRLLAKAFGRAARPSAEGCFEVEPIRFDWRCLEYRFEGEIHRISTPALAALTLVIGVVGGAYGVGGGAIIAPILVTLFRLPVHSVAGATLLGTWVTSVAGVLFFTVAGPLLGTESVAPDWTLGLLLGAGGFGGMYLGARLQRRVPGRWIERLLGVAVSGLAISYVIGFFSS